MSIDRNSHIHLYLQIADNLRRSIASGAFPPGGVLPTEEELCKQFGVSRYPMRQAMSLLVEEGLLVRARGKGTFVNAPDGYGAAAESPPQRSRSIALVLPRLDGDFPMDILRGFEKASTDNDFTAFVAVSAAPEAEIGCIERAIRCGAAGIVVFPVSNTAIDEEKLNGWIAQGVYMSLIDRNPGLDHIDFVGSDNSGGGYLAAHHMHLHGYGAAVFVADQTRVSSVKERFGGFQKGLNQFGMRLLNGERAGIEGDGPERFYCGICSFAEDIGRYGAQLPFAVFAENDYTAERVLSILQDKGLAAGTDAGVIGFDNSSRCEFLTPKLTSIAQNGVLIGETAARLAMEKIETGSRQSVRHILPTQLAARKSCGEGI